MMTSKRKSPVVLQTYDYKQMFDAIHLEQALSDIYDYGLNDDNLPLIYQANRDVRMAVNTPAGLTERQRLENVVLQGDTFGSILASVQVDTIGKEVEDSGYGYMYQDKLPVSLLGLVDDMIGVTEAGYKAQQLNALLNVKTAEKRLQFGVSKCKTMLVGKNKESVINNPLTVDKWSVIHVENIETKDSDLIETYEGRVEIKNTDNQKYLGFVLSCKGDNMVNINAMKKKSIWIIRKIFTKLDSLHLKKYYFECGMIFLNVMLRSSIFYACETYYNLKETEIRQLERIEESFLRKLFKTSRGCPLSQLYLESGHTPARYHVKKTRLLFLQYILKEEPSSLIYRFLYQQFEKRTRGDWASSCLDDLKDLKTEMSLEDIKAMSKNKFCSKVKKAIQETAFKYLIQKRGSKGQEITYKELKKADYLLPGYFPITIEEQRSIFEIRNRMVYICSNFSNGMKKEICPCGLVEDMKHIYICKLWSTRNHIRNGNQKPEYEIIFSDNISEQIKVNKYFIMNFQERETYEKETKPHAILDNSDPLYSVLENSNGQ